MKDFRELLVKYIMLVRDQEGIDYIDHAEWSPVQLTSIELDLLRYLSDEASERLK